MPAAAPLDAVRALLPALRDAAPATERRRRLASDLVVGLARAGVSGLGGLEAHPATLLATLEALAHADGAAGWCAMIGATTALVAAYLPEPVAGDIWSRDPDVVTGGVFAPTGVATVVDGGHRVCGHWRFASGCEHCRWLMLGCVVRDDGPPRARMFVVPADAVQVVDTWDVAGLRGTGSHDLVADDVFVPAGRSVSLADDRPVAPGPLFAFPIFGLLALGIAAVALGVATRAIDELARLAREKTATGMRRRLAERAAVQQDVAQAEAAVGAARAYVHAVVAAAWDAATATGQVGLAERARLRLAATHATVAAASAVDAMYAAGGGTAIYAESALQRCFRDVHVVTQHMMVAQPTWELVGRLLLGVDADTSLL
jgi:alkylation response protein AidB-like acyl-CoA dehydrogenase